MLPHHGPTIDELLRDSLVQAVMRADKVEPQALRLLLGNAASRVAASRLQQEPRSASGLLSRQPIDKRSTSRAANGSTRVPLVARARQLARARAGALLLTSAPLSVCRCNPGRNPS